MKKRLTLATTLAVLGSAQASYGNNTWTCTCTCPNPPNSSFTINSPTPQNFCDNQCDAMGEGTPGTLTNCSKDAAVPAVSEWGLVVMTLLALTMGTVMLFRQRRRAAV